MQPESLVRTFIEQSFNKGDLSVLEEVIHTEYKYASPDTQLTGIGELKAFIQAFRNAFPDMHIRIDDFFASGDRSCAQFTFRGTHKEDFMGIPATNKAVKVQGVVMSRFRDNKIVEEWELLDNLTFFQQLGVVPDLSSLPG